MNEMTQNPGNSKHPLAAVVLVAAFLSMLLLPTLCSLLGFDPAPAQGESKRPKPWPALPGTWEEAAAFPGQFNTAHKERAGLRKACILVYQWLRLAGGVNPYGTEVIFGKDWNLYKNSGGGLCDIWRAVDPLEPSELNDWEKALRERHEFMAARGGMYIYAIVPDRQTVYPEFLPAAIRPSGNPRRIEQVYEHLARQAPDLAVVDFRQVLKNAAEPAYPKADTHWNSYGAYLSYVEIMRVIARRYPALTPHPLEIFDIEHERIRGEVLAKMTMTERLVPDNLVHLKPKTGWHARKSEEKLPPSVAGVDPRPGWKPRSYTQDNPELPRALLLCDSMETRLTPFLAEHFSWLGVYRQDAFDPELVETLRADIVIQERSEEYAVPFIPENDPRVGGKAQEEDVAGWRPLQGTVSVKSVEPPEGASSPVIQCKTSLKPWAGALYGCAKANVADGNTLPCPGNGKYRVVVWVKGEPNSLGLNLQLHLVGNHGENFGATPFTLNGEWQRVERAFATKQDTTHLGIQVVKRNQPGVAAFLLVQPVLEAQ